MSDQTPNSKPEDKNQEGFADYAKRHVKSLVNKPWQKALPHAKLCNLKTLGFMVAGYIALYLPMISIFGSTMSISEMESRDLVAVGYLQFWFLIAFVLFAIGASPKVAKVALLFALVCVLFISIDIYEGVSEVTGALSGLAGLFGQSSRSGMSASDLAFTLVSGSILLLMFVPFFLKQSSNTPLWGALNNIHNDKDPEPVASGKPEVSQS